MYIVHIATELASIAKVGGLGDVIYGLSQETAKRGHELEIILPRYDCINYGLLKNLKVEMLELWSFENQQRFNNTIWSAEFNGLKVLLLEPHHPLFYYSRGMIYGCTDDNDRFLYFCRSSMEFLFKSGRRPDIIHVHDWPTAIVPLLYKEMYRPLGMKVGGIIFTIHNLDHQGKCAIHNLTKVGLRGENYLSIDELQDPAQSGVLNLMKGAIKYSDFITTVSPTYEKEIKTQEGGRGLYELLLKNQKKLKGILNGIDNKFWDPETDPYLIKKYSPGPIQTEDKLKQVIQAKKENREHLSKHLLINLSDSPLVVCISRLVPQKGTELIIQSIRRTIEKGGQFILLGSSPIKEITQSFQALQKEFIKNKNVSISLDHNEALAHLIYAAADMIVIPSLFEPCGLTQMIALRYGTIPIVRLTGGLADTVFDVDTSKEPAGRRNGFSFDFPDLKGINWAMDRAIDCYVKEPKKRQMLMQNGMNMDFSWTKASDEYLKIYEKSASKKEINFPILSKKLS